MPEVRFRGELLRELRTAAGLTQAEVAAKLRLAGGVRIGQWERGAEQPRPGFVRELARLFRVAPMSLLDVDPADPPLAAWRLAAGLTLQKLSARSKVPVMTYHRLERGVGVARPSEQVVGRLARALRIPAHQVMQAVEATRSASS